MNTYDISKYISEDVNFKAGIISENSGRLDPVNFDFGLNAGDIYADQLEDNDFDLEKVGQLIYDMTSDVYDRCDRIYNSMSDHSDTLDAENSVIHQSLRKFTSAVEQFINFADPKTFRRLIADIEMVGDSINQLSNLHNTLPPFAEISSDRDKSFEISNLLDAWYRTILQIYIRAAQWRRYHNVDSDSGSINDSERDQ